MNTSIHFVLQPKTWTRLCAALSAFASAGAIAAATDPGVTVTVVPDPTSVTLSRLASKTDLDLTTYAAYRVTVTNTTTNTLNRVFFNATVAYVGSTEPVVIDSTVPAAAGCTITNPTIACSLGSLTPGALTSLYIVVRAPTTGTRITVAGAGGGEEGNGNGNGCCDVPASAFTSLIDSTTDPTTNPSFLTKVTSFVRPVGGTIFTGAEAISTTDDGWTTLVKVPAFTFVPQTTATVVEPTVSSSCQPYAIRCFKSVLTIPGQFAKLEITFRWDSAYFKLGSTKPADVKLFYTGSNLSIQYPIQLALCSADAITYGPAPSLGRPCLTVPPKKLSNQDTPVKALWGDLEFRVEALDNGSYEG